jgi:hypothetical protein
MAIADNTILNIFQQNITGKTQQCQEMGLIKKRGGNFHRLAG